MNTSISRFSQVTGYTFEEAVGRNPRILQSGRTRPEVYRELWNTLGSGGEWRGEFLNKKKNGELYWELATISSIKSNDGSITNYLAVKEDITERRRVEQKIKSSENSIAHHLR